MMTLTKTFACGLVLAVLPLFCSTSPAQTLAIPGYPVARDVPGAHDLPDPNTVYKVVFDIGQAASKPGDVNPGLIGIAKYINTLARYGVPVSHRKIAVIFHQKAVDIVENNEAFKARHGGIDNPNIALIRSLAKAGVQFHVCGQGVMNNKIDPGTIQPEIQLDLWALTTLVDLELQGYVHIPN